MKIGAPEVVAQRILLIRNQRVMLDADLATLYDVPTKRLNEQVKRNIERFPDDFMFQLTQAEKAEVVANCDHLANLKFSASLPYAFKLMATPMPHGRGIGFTANIEPQSKGRK